MRITMIMGNTPKVGTGGLGPYRLNPQADPWWSNTYTNSEPGQQDRGWVRPTSRAGSAA